MTILTMVSISLRFPV